MENNITFLNLIFNKKKQYIIYKNMDKEIKNIFLIIGLNVEKIEDFEGLFIPREQLLCDLKYNETKFDIE